MVDTGRSRHGTDIKQNTHVGVQDLTKSIEEPSMRVDLPQVHVRVVESVHHVYRPSFDSSPSSKRSLEWEPDSSLRLQS